LPKINILFLPYHNTGGHFIDWSVYFLSGQDQYFDGVTVRPLLLSPLSNGVTNCHNHKSLITQGLSDLKEKIMQIDKLQLPVVNIYTNLLDLYKLVKQLFDSPVENATKLQFDQALDHMLLDAQETVTWLQQLSYPIAFFDFQKDDFLNITYNNRKLIDVNGTPLDSIAEYWNSYVDTFFKNNQQFDQNVWDRREQLALIMRPDKDNNYYNLVDRTQPHLYYNTDDIWNDLPEVMKEMLDFFNLTMDSDRFNSWLPIYNAWRSKHDPYFSRHYDRILDAIVNNEYINLRRFNLNFYKEALIQRGLITKYNLNLKTWQLTTFPLDTQALHELLEPNIHTL
jgi:hypothetical protein